MADDDSLSITLVYYGVAAIIMLSAYFFPAKNELATYVPIMLSIVLLIPIFLWQSHYSKKTELPKTANGKDRETVLFWIFVLFALALTVRIPSVLLFNEPYEKTPLIYLLILTILVIEKVDVSAFGFKTRNLAKSLGYGLAFFGILGGCAVVLRYALIWGFTGQSPVESYNFVPFLLAMPFMTLCVGISEEGLFRGYMQTRLTRIYSSKQAILVQAVMFGIWHFVWNLRPLDLLSMMIYVATTFLVGLVFGYFYSRSNNLAPLVLAHGLWNSVPTGIVENGSLMTYFWTYPMLNQLAVLIVPFAVAGLIALLFTKYAVKEI